MIKNSLEVLERLEELSTLALSIKELPSMPYGWYLEIEDPLDTARYVYAEFSFEDLSFNKKNVMLLDKVPSLEVLIDALYKQANIDSCFPQSKIEECLLKDYAYQSSLFKESVRKLQKDVEIFSRNNPEMNININLVEVLLDAVSSYYKGSSYE